MPRASKRYLTRKVDKDLDDNFSFLISSLSSPADIEQFFSDFLSSEEKVMLSKRLMLHLMLESGYKQSEIKAILGMSKDTVRVHEHIWRKGNVSYRKIIKKIVKREQTKQFFKKVESILKPIDLLLQSRANMKARAKAANADWD